MRMCPTIVETITLIIKFVIEMLSVDFWYFTSTAINKLTISYIVTIPDKLIKW